MTFPLLRSGRVSSGVQEKQQAQPQAPTHTIPPAPLLLWALSTGDAVWDLWHQLGSRLTPYTVVTLLF